MGQQKKEILPNFTVFRFLAIIGGVQLVVSVCACATNGFAPKPALIEAIIG